jgi:hypothetical protein
LKRQLILAVLCIVSSIGLAQAEANPSDLIVGVWEQEESDTCWGNTAEYLEDGTKIVTVKFCDAQGNSIELQYMAKWTIAQNRIKEVTFVADPELLSILGTTLPHTEIDSIGELNQKRLVIIDNKTPDNPTVYRRVR